MERLIMEVKIWDVVEGPLAIEDMPKEEAYDTPEGSEYYMICKAEIDGIIGEDNFWFEDFDSAYEWKKYFMENIEPIVVDIDSLCRYN